LQVLVSYRLLEPGSEWRCHRLWYDRTALGDLLGEGFSLGGKDQLYATLDHLLPHKEALFSFLRQRWEDLFGIKYDILLYDLTSTYFEGQSQDIPKAEHGYSRDHRPDCRQVMIALVVTPEGFPLAYEVMPGGTSDKTTLRGFVEKIEKLHGQAQRIWVMDRGVPTEEVLAELRAMNPRVFYLVGTPKAWVRHKQEQWENITWQKVRDSVEVKLFEEKGELFVVARSDPRQQKEIAIRRKKLARLLWTLRAMRREKSRDKLLQRLGVARSKAGRCARLVEIHLPKIDEPINRQTFTVALQKEGLKAAELYDGHYLLRTNMKEKAPDFLWQMYMRLVEIEGVFKTFKNDLHLRPIYHWSETRVEAHILVCFLAYCLHVTLKEKLRALAPGLTPRAVLDQLAGIQMLDVELPTTDDRWLTLKRYTQPDKACQLILAQLKMTLPEQAPPRLSSERKLDLVCAKM
jgi:transposase